MRLILFLIIGLISCLGCARVKVEAPKEPIKVDVSMRLDIYQHVEKDIDSGESIVSGEKAKPKISGTPSPMGQAYSRRRERRPDLRAYQAQGILGENKNGLLEARGSVDEKAKNLLADENKDRLVIYEALAKKNNTSPQEVQKLYAEKLQRRASTGTPIEVYDAQSNSFQWQTKKEQ